MLTAALPRVKFLLVDDREENLFALSEILRRDGLELVTARSGSAALEQILQHDFALAIIDVQMPEMDGVELAEIMRGAERTRSLPIILVTAGRHEESRLFHGYEAGAVDFLYKPIEPVVLRNKAETFFELYRQRQQLARQLDLLRELTAKLEETLRLNELFVAAVGHDLRNPLLAIIAGAQLITRRSVDPEAVRLAATVLDGGKRMDRMTSALFDLTRARLGGGMPILRARVDLRPLAERVFEEHKLAAPNHELRLQVEGEVLGDWDGTRLEQLLSNLLGNAVQHGSRSIPIELKVRAASSERVQLEVTSGGRIPEPALAELFNPFRRFGDARRSDGLGLGLYIVQQIAVAHGGQVEVDSSDARGTTFRVLIPREVAAPPVISA
jgi:two-component system, sensor histidine kinase and response regulator